MELWVMTRGWYDSETIIGVASSETRAKELLEDAGFNGTWNDAGSVYGPFRLDQLNMEDES